VNYKHVITVIDPINGEILYTKGMRLTVDYYRQAIDNMCLLYVYLKQNNISNYDIVNTILDMRFKVELENKVQIQTSDQILRRHTTNYVKIFSYNLEEKKIIAYLKMVILGQYDVMDEITNSIYTFIYEYLVQDTPIGGIYRGYTELKFTYFNTTCKVIYDPNIYEDPLLIVNKYYQGIENIHYNIAIKTTKGMSDLEFEKTIQQCRLRPQTGIEMKNILKKLNKKRTGMCC